MVELAKGRARTLAAAAGISEEEYPAFEEEIVADFLAEADASSSIEEWLAPGGVYDAEAKVLSSWATWSLPGGPRPSRKPPGDQLKKDGNRC